MAPRQCRRLNNLIGAVVVLTQFRRRFLRRRELIKRRHHHAPVSCRSRIVSPTDRVHFVSRRIIILYAFPPQVERVRRR